MCVRLLRQRRQDGFTLVELLVSITILGVLVGALAGALLGILEVNTRTGTRLDATRSEQFAATAFATDVQGMKASGGLVTTGSARCGTAAGFLFEIRGTTYDPAAVTTARTTTATYVVESTTVDGAPARQIRRLWCEATASAAEPLTPSRDEILVRNLSDTAPAAPTVSGDRVTWTLTRLDGTSFTLLAVRRPA